MSVLEKFFICSCVFTFASALLATWVRYLPTFISLYQLIVNYLEQFNPKLDFLTEFKAYPINRKQVQS